MGYAKTMNRIEATHKHVCIDCGVEEVLKYPTYWYRVRRGTNKCGRCSKKGGNQTSFKKNQVPHNKGQAGYGKWAKWYPKGELNPAWKGGVTPKNKLFRKTPEYKAWRAAILERDDYTCQFCSQRGGALHVDHIKPFAYYKELRLDINNGRVLCVDCHKKTDTYLSGAHKYAV